MPLLRRLWHSWFCSSKKGSLWVFQALFRDLRETDRLALMEKHKLNTPQMGLVTAKLCTQCSPDRLLQSPPYLLKNVLINGLMAHSIRFALQLRHLVLTALNNIILHIHMILHTYLQQW